MGNEDCFQISGENQSPQALLKPTGISHLQNTDIQERIPRFLSPSDLYLLDLSDNSVGKESPLQCRRPQVDSCVGKIHWRRDRLPTPVFKFQLHPLLAGDLGETT